MTKADDNTEATLSIEWASVKNKYIVQKAPYGYKCYKMKSYEIFCYG